MTDRAVVFLESSTSGHLFVRAARNLGFRPVLVTSKEGRYRNLSGVPIDIAFGDTSDVEAMLQLCNELHHRHPIAGIISTSGAYAAMAATLCRWRRLPGADPQAIDNCQNKFRQRQTLREAGLLSPVYRLAHDTSSAVDATAGLEFPVVVKPVVGSGSTGVRLCFNTQEVAKHVEEVQALRDEGVSSGLLIEEFIAGPEYSVETIADTVLGITRKHLGALPHFVEIGHDFPATLAGTDQAAIKSSVLSALQALQLTWGPAHTELRLHSRGPVIIEVNPRMGGDMIPELVRLASGVDTVTETIRLVTGMPTNLSPQARRQASIRFLNPEADGLVSWHTDPDAVRSMPDVSEVELYAADGGEVRRRGDYRDRIGHVIVAGENRQQVEESLATALGNLRYTIEERTI